MKLLNFNIIKLTCYLIIGILIGFYFKTSLTTIIIIYSVLFVSLTISYLVYRNKSFQSCFFGLITFLTFICIGIVTTKLYDDKTYASHYTNQNLSLDKQLNISFRLIKRLKPDHYNTKFFAELIRIDSISTTGLVLINVKKDTLSPDLKIGGHYFTNAKIAQLNKPKNPFQFDYKTYLKQRNSHHQIYLEANTIVTISTNTCSLYGYADNFRSKINRNLKKAGFADDVLSIINALLLGQRQDIRSEIYTNYANAGVIHILAVSGLHVGIIFLLLTRTLKPLHLIKNGKHIIKPLLIIIILWCFAFVAGLSPSVTRAVTMFSIITCAQFLKRPTNIYNTLTISAFLMLLIKPIYLFDVGFQMSYLAVLAIVAVQPLLYKLWKPSNIILDKTWQILTVTVAAQLGVAPLSLFYFHQFPGLFFVSNLVIIPFLGIILSFGLLVIVLALLYIVPEIIVSIYSFIINNLNNFIAWIAQFEDFLLSDIYFNIYYVFAMYLILISCLYVWKTKSYKSLRYLLVSVLLLSTSMIYTKHINSSTEFVIFNKNRATLLGKKTNNHLSVYSNLKKSELNTNKTLKNYSLGHNIRQQTHDSLEFIYAYKDNVILILDSLNVYDTKKLKPNYVLLSHSPKLNLNRLIDSLKPQQIIADASNYKSYVERWKQTCINKKIPFHSTYEKGAFIISE